MGQRSRFVDLGLNVSSFTHKCGCMVDGCFAMAAT